MKKLLLLLPILALFFTNVYGSSVDVPGQAILFYTSPSDLNMNQQQIDSYNTFKTQHQLSFVAYINNSVLYFYGLDNITNVELSVSYIQNYGSDDWIMNNFDCKKTWYSVNSTGVVTQSDTMTCPIGNGLISSSLSNPLYFYSDNITVYRSSSLTDKVYPYVEPISINLTSSLSTDSTYMSVTALSVNAPIDSKIQYTELASNIWSDYTETLKFYKNGDFKFRIVSATGEELHLSTLTIVGVKVGVIGNVEYSSDRQLATVTLTTSIPLFGARIQYTSYFDINGQARAWLNYTTPFTTNRNGGFRTQILDSGGNKIYEGVVNVDNIATPSNPGSNGYNDDVYIDDSGFTDTVPTLPENPTIFDYIAYAFAIIGWLISMLIHFLGNLVSNMGTVGQLFAKAFNWLPQPLPELFIIGFIVLVITSFRR